MMLMGLQLGSFLMIVFPLLGLVLWWWNEIWYVRAFKAKCSTFNTKIPPGQLGLPLFGETFSFLWFFNKARRPDDFINSKKIKYGENVGIYKTHLYGAPSIIACSPELCKLVLTSSDKFKQERPNTEVLGPNSVVTLQGPRHVFIKSLVVSSINRPDSLSRFLLQVQPNIVEAFHLLAQKPKFTAIRQLQKVTLNYTMKYFCGFEAGSQLDEFESLFEGINHGMRALPWNFPGTAYHHALKCRKTITKKLKEELEKRKKIMESNNKNDEETEESNDLMDGLLQVKDKEGKQLSEEEVLDNVVSTIHIGHASIAFVMTWSLYFLSKFPHVFQKLKEENMDMSREKNGGHITYDDIMKLKYTNKVIEETFRMANLSSFVFKKATEDIEFK
ncbi:Beta-amyrin 11-oxidase, partial [Bienertia sinuspersici]